MAFIIPNSTCQLITRSSYAKKREKFHSGAFIQLAEFDRPGTPKATYLHDGLPGGKQHQSARMQSVAGKAGKKDLHRLVVQIPLIYIRGMLEWLDPVQYKYRFLSMQELEQYLGFFILMNWHHSLETIELKRPLKKEGGIRNNCILAFLRIKVPSEHSMRSAIVRRNGGDKIIDQR